MPTITQQFEIQIDGRNVILSDTDNHDDPRPNRLEIPIGSGASHGWFLMLKQDANEVLAAGTVSVLFRQSDDQGNSTETVFRNMVVKSVEDFGPGGADAETEVALVEITDVRWIWQRRSALQAEFNVPLVGEDVDPGGVSGDGFKESSLKSGSPYTWEQMLQEIWDTLTPVGAQWPGLPVGTAALILSQPYDWRFQGVNAWQAFNTVLARIGKVVVYDPTSANFPFAIRDMGAQHADTNNAINQLGPPLTEHFGATGLQSGIPGVLRVYPPTQTDLSEFEDPTEVYQKRWHSEESDVISRTFTGGGGILPVWSDLPNLTNDAGEQNTAQTEGAADEIFLGLADDLSIETHRQRFAGVAYIPLDGTRKSIVFTYVISSSSGTGGFFTTFASHPGEPTVGLYSGPRFRWWVDRLSPPHIQQYLRPSLPIPEEKNHYLGKTVNAISKLADGRITVVKGNLDPVDPPEERQATNYFADLGADATVLCVKRVDNVGGDVIVAGEC